MLLQILVLFFLGLQLCSTCDMDQTKEGCRIRNRICLCGVGCSSEYRYDTYEECQNALKGKKPNYCNPNPCMHGGSCTQISKQPKYACKCEGTGYFGQRCNRACPNPGASGSINSNIFSWECIVI